MAQEKSPCQGSLSEGLGHDSGICQGLRFYPKHHTQTQNRLWTGHRQVLLTLSPGDIILGPKRTPFPLAGLFLTPDTFSQCSWQQGAVGQLVLPDLSNFTQHKNVLGREFDGFFSYLFFNLCSRED